jgi:hypothetical protein
MKNAAKQKVFLSDMKKPTKRSFLLFSLQNATVKGTSQNVAVLVMPSLRMPD